VNSQFISSALLLLVILNPFALAVYLVDVFRQNDMRVCSSVVTRAMLISFLVFGVFVWTGDAFFRVVLQVRFEAFQLFGGALFFVIALRFMLGGHTTLVSLRGEPKHLAGAIAMPFMIGPGSVSAATLAGLRLGPVLGTLCIGAALSCAGVMLMLLKAAFDHMQRNNAALIERYVEVASRISAMVIGSIAVEMILRGLESWTRASQAAG